VFSGWHKFSIQMMIRFHLSPKFCVLRLLHCVHHLKFQNQETAINIVIQMESNISFCFRQQSGRIREFVDFKYSIGE
jgi:hypothetical protein